MEQVRLGRSELWSSTQGLGCMGMSEFYGQGDEAESQAVLARAIELGINHLDTSDLYGKGQNELLIGRFLKGRPRDSILLASKFGVVRDPDGPLGSMYDRDLDNSPAYARKALEASLKRLGTDYIDLYYIHRYDPATPIEEAIEGLAALVREGKIRAIGLSEVTPELLRRADAVHPIAALQSEYSMFSRDIEAEILPTCRELGVAFLPYSPLGRGILAGKIRSVDDLAADDLRRNSPMFSPANLPANIALVDKVAEIAAKRGATSGQIALAWLNSKGRDIIPLPGTKRVKYLEENAAAADIKLTAAELAALEANLRPDMVAGGGKWSTAPQKKAADAAPKPKTKSVAAKKAPVKAKPKAAPKKRAKAPVKKAARKVVKKTAKKAARKVSRKAVKKAVRKKIKVAPKKKAKKPAPKKAKKKVKKR